MTDDDDQNGRLTRQIQLWLVSSSLALVGCEQSAPPPPHGPTITPAGQVDYTGGEAEPTRPGTAGRSTTGSSHTVRRSRSYWGIPFFYSSGSSYHSTPSYRPSSSSSSGPRVTPAPSSTSHSTASRSSTSSSSSTHSTSTRSTGSVSRGGFGHSGHSVSSSS